MKRILLVIVLAVCLFAAGFTEEEKSLREGLRELNNVRDAEIVVLGDSAVVALKSAPLFFKSDFNALEATVTLYLQQARGDIANIYFSHDLDIFLKTAALSRKIESDGALLYKDEIFELIHIIESRSGSFKKAGIDKKLFM